MNQNHHETNSMSPTTSLVHHDDVGYGSSRSDVSTTVTTVGASRIRRTYDDCFSSSSSMGGEERPFKRFKMSNYYEIEALVDRNFTLLTLEYVNSCVRCLKRMGQVRSCFSFDVLEIEEIRRELIGVLRGSTDSHEYVFYTYVLFRVPRAVDNHESIVHAVSACLDMNTLNFEPWIQNNLICELLNIKGNALLALGRSIEAVTCYSRAIELSGDFPEYYINRGYGYFRLQQHHLAINDLSKGIELHSRTEIPSAKLCCIREKRAICHKSINQLELAIIDFTFVLRYQPTNINSYSHRADCLSKLGKCREAIEDLKIVVKHRPSDDSVLNKLALNYIRIQDYDNASVYARQALTIHPTGWARMFLAQIYFQRKQYLEALEEFTKELSINRCALALYLRGMCSEKLGMTEKAASDYEDALDLDRNQSATWFRLSMIYKDQDRGIESLAFATKALELCNSVSFRDHYECCKDTVIKSSCGVFW